MDNKPSFHTYINESLDDYVNLHKDLICKIRFRERIKLSLIHLLETCDEITFEAFQEGKNMEKIKIKTQWGNGQT